MRRGLRGSSVRSVSTRTFLTLFAAVLLSRALAQAGSRGHGHLSFSLMRVAPRSLLVKPINLTNDQTTEARMFAAGNTSTATPTATPVQHYEYVFPDGNIYVYDIDNSFNLIKQISVPTDAGTRG